MGFDTIKKVLSSSSEERKNSIFRVFPATEVNSLGFSRNQLLRGKFRALVTAIAKGLVFALRRLLKCHPFCNGGYDPIPKKTER